VGVVSSYNDCDLYYHSGNHIIYTRATLRHGGVKFPLGGGGCGRGIPFAGLRFCPATVISFKPNVLHVSRTNRETAASAVLLYMYWTWYIIYNIQPEDGWWAWRVDTTRDRTTAYFNIILNWYWCFNAHKRDLQSACSNLEHYTVFPKLYQ